MESRGGSLDTRPRNRPAIARKSCDPCRSRKVGCDRGSPCSNCVSAKLDCTHSAVVSNAASARQRVLISSQYEQKIDDIAASVDGIKRLLLGLNLSSDSNPMIAQPTDQPDVADYRVEQRPILPSAALDHSAHIIDFVRAVIDDKSLRDSRSGVDETFRSLEKLVQTLEDPANTRNSSYPDRKVGNYRNRPPMPPLEAVVTVLRWAKEHQHYFRIAWISQVLPLENFAEICRKVYFAVDDYSEIEFVLANAYLSYVFSEHIVSSGLQEYREYCQVCRNNLNIALARLPLLVPATMEAVAALLLGAFNNAVEDSTPTIAWTFISAAADLCLTLGYHRNCSQPISDDSLQSAQQSLFWIVHRIEKGLSLKLNRPSNIRDADVNFPDDENMDRGTKIARIQGRVYDQLYGPAALQRPNDERGHNAEALAKELRDLIDQGHLEIYEAQKLPVGDNEDPMRVTYMRFDLICQSSLLTLVLRAVSPKPGFLNMASGECVAAARETLEMHHTCMLGMQASKGSPFLVMKYLSWAILHVPFVAFSILFTRAVQLLDIDDLAFLDRFEASLRPEADSSKSITHPYRLYELLCQAARLYIESVSFPATVDPVLSQKFPGFLGEFEPSHFGEVGSPGRDTSIDANTQMFGLSDWYYSNQQMMSLLDEDIAF
ncbi:hypothetical protein BDV95DRAFT_535423 [Massariosphaeria phaeospora]|uniref:Zn(2)-C6 fungal-type domain-containing protein n=1 Tax=Massariosphaeria phaeospora TaxID=100035 RepID=A0A7C8MGG4_9PLEO|nr:hypothetical protein BDV95DRAFT_535423 [Massariosphaeria phaeospora]